MYCKKLILDNLNADQPLFFDTETVGLYGRTRLVQVRQGDVAYEYDCFYINIEEIKHALKDFHLVIHNAHYDLSCLNFRSWIPRKLDCTMYLSRIAWPELDSHSLDALSKHFKLDVKTDEGASDWSQYALTESQIKYSSTDTKLVEDIYNLLPKEVFDNNSYRLAIESLKVALEMQNKGMPVNHESLLKIKRQLLKEKKMVETKLPPGLNVDSPKQVKEYLNIESSAKGELFKLKDTRSEVILKAREINKALTFVDLFDNKKFIYSFTNPTGAKTGRATSKGCDLFDDYTNLQQIPRDLKSVFGVRNGAFYITADYPALEIRTTCAVFDDDFLYDALKNNKNLHNETCLKLYGKGKSEISERQYVAAKSCNFSLMYGAGPKGLYDIFWTRGFETTEQECYDLVNKWWGIYKGISQTRLDAIQYFKTHSFSITRTPLGYPIKNRSFTEHLASVPQGAGAECTKMAMYLLKKEYGIIPVNAVHDSIVAVASSYKEAEDFAKGIKWAMEEGFRRITRNCLHNDIPCEVDVYIGEDYK